METYTVKAGDSLSKIALAKLGDLNRWRELAALNQISDPNLIRVGQVLQLPKVSATTIVDAPPAPTDIPDIVDPGTGLPSMTVTAKREPIPWLGIAIAVSILYYLSRKR